MTPMYEDAGCVNPCGEEPMGCARCPERGNTGRPHDKAWAEDNIRHLERLGIDMDDPRFDDMLGQMG